MARRVCAASETWDRIQPLLKKIGITRVGDITGLDRIGIPVWIAVRPNSRTLSVSQGKGLDGCSARVSAAMESIETAFAERPKLNLEFGTVADLPADKPTVDLGRLPRPRKSLFGSKRAVFWACARDWYTQESVWVPYELVHADATLPWLPGGGSFLPSTNGLASGNVLREAILHGLCEVVERDCLALWEHCTRGLQEQRRLDLNTICDADVCGLIDKFRRAFISPIVWDVTSDVEVPAFRAIICDEKADPVWHPFPAAFGAGCHPDPIVAIIRALTEAAQSRLTVISGSRDDFDRARYSATQAASSLAFNRDLAHAGNGSYSFRQSPQVMGMSIEAEIDYIADRLAHAGMREILYVDLSDSAFPISVARVIVPGLEGPTEAPLYSPGARVRALLAARPK